jgi:hypothetical protein
MPFGLDTFESHLDQIKSSDWDVFKLWNGGQVINGKVEGGDPVFAGRNFLGGSFLWGNAEATDAMINPHPKKLTQLNLLAPLIAPVQAPQPDRQKVTGRRGHIYGQIDAGALCDRIAAGIAVGEYEIPNGRLYVWLAVDPEEDFSADYWAGWSDKVNSYPRSLGLHPPLITQPFMAGILCKYAGPTAGELRRDGRIDQALERARQNYHGLDTRVLGFWADAPDPDEDNVPPNPPVNWSVRFVQEEMPLIWRLANGIRKANGTAVNESFTVDAVKGDADSPPVVGQPATDWMLVTKRWQPNYTIVNPGFSVADEIRDANLNCILKTALPDMPDTTGIQDSQVQGGSVTIVGRYLERPVNHGDSLTVDEATRLSDAGLRIFSIWERYGGPTKISYFKPPGVGVDGQGTLDGREAFRRCGEVLHQPPQTPVCKHSRPLFMNALE